MGVREVASALVGGEARAVSYQDVWGKGGDWRVMATGATAEAALGLPVVFGCVDLIAGQIASMPLQTFRRDGNGVRVRVADGPLLTSPSVSLASDEWLYVAAASMLVHGEAIGPVLSLAPTGFPAQVEWVAPRRMRVELSPAGPLYWLDGEPIPRDRVVHIRHGVLRPGELRGQSPIQALPDPLRSGLEALRYERDWFTGGAHPSGVLTVQEPILTDEQSSRIKRKFMAAVKGREPVVLGSIASYSPIQSDPSSAGLDAARQRIATDIAIAFHVPPSMVGGTSGSMTYTNLEADQASLEVRALAPVYRRIERALSRLMPAPDYVRFNADAVLRTDARTRSAIASEMVRAGIKSRDELRELEELPPIPDGSGGAFLWPPGAVTLPESSESSGVMDVSIAAQRLYLAVANGVLTREEAREQLNKLGAGLSNGGGQ
jgi:HK97 family phage portal protein